jgi:glycosyltransferase involved in cell wall biosynthesis
MTNFSVLVSIYYKETSRNLAQCLESLASQTLLADEVVVVKDGILTDSLEKTLSEWQKKLPLKIVGYKENKGLAYALNYGLAYCSNELIARMDSDDICAPDRFEKQIKLFKEYPDIDVLGGFIYEFIDDIKNLVAVRDVPLNDYDIKKYFRRRDPVNHVTVMLKKSSLLKVGNYQDWYLNEDTYLWCRMILAGCKFMNIPAVLVYVRVGKDMYNRRGGLKYFIYDSRLQKYKFDNKIVNFYEYVTNVFIRFIVQVLMPNSIRHFIYRHFFRKRFYQIYFLKG